MQATTSTSSLYPIELRGQQTVPEFYEKVGDNGQVNQKNGAFPITKDVAHFGTNKHKSYHREIHIQQINDALLYDSHYNKKHTTLEMESSPVSSSLKYNLGPIGNQAEIQEVVKHSKGYEQNQSDVLATQLDGLKDLNAVNPMLRSKSLITSPKQDDVTSEFSLDRSISPTTSSLSTSMDAQGVDMKSLYNQIGTGLATALSCEQQMALETDKRAIYRYFYYSYYIRFKVQYCLVYNWFSKGPLDTSHNIL